MKEEEQEIVNDMIASEGFDYAFLYFDFEDVKDKRFHKLREKYVDIRSELSIYVNHDE